MTETAAPSERIDQLLDAIELVRSAHREEARRLLRDLIREDGNFEDAWLWMSVAVDNLDQSAVCLDNVLRVNPNNVFAAGALYRLREPERWLQQQRGRWVLLRDLAFYGFWALVIALLFGVLFSYYYWAFMVE